MPIDYHTIEPPIRRASFSPLPKSCTRFQVRLWWNQTLSRKEAKLIADFLQDYPRIDFRIFGDGSLKNLDFLEFFPFLCRFQIDVFSLQDWSGLRSTPRLKSLGLGVVKRNAALSLKVLESLPQLDELSLVGHQKDIDVISTLTHLKRLMLLSIKLPNLRILVAMQQLWWLAIKLGGTNDLSLLPRLRALKYLDLCKINGLSQLDAISDCDSLRCLLLQSLRQVRHLPSFRRLDKLRQVRLMIMNGLSDLSSLLTAKALEDLSVEGCKHIEPANFACLRKHPRLKRIRIGPWYSGRTTQKHEMARQIVGLPDLPDNWKWRFN